MRLFLPIRSVIGWLLFLSLTSFTTSTATFAADPPTKAESAYVRLLKNPKTPPERLPAIIDVIGKRGSADDLAYLFTQALPGGSFTGKTRVEALKVLADASRTRSVVPAADLGKLVPLLKSDAKADPELVRAAMDLAGTWKLEAAGPTLQSIATAADSTDARRSAAIDALTAIGGAQAKLTIDALADPKQPLKLRAAALAAMVKLDLNEAPGRAPEILAKAGGDFDPAPLVIAFLNRQGASDVLAASLAKAPLPPDAAKMVIRAMYSLGRTDAALVAELSKEAGLDAEIKPLTKNEMDALVAEVAAKGNAERGENIFRRPDLSCTNCHALSRAGGGIGPDLSAVGVSSPVDYLVHAILSPDQDIKEAFISLVVSTEEGQIYQGIVADKDNTRIVLKQANGELQTVAVAEIDEQKEGGSLMPKGLPNLMTHAEFVDVIRFLSELGKPGTPYAVRSVPSIQRWRVLKPVPDPLSKSTPDAASLRSQVFEAPAENWLPIYGKVDGSLPLDEVKALSGGNPVVYVRGELDASAAGPVVIRLNSSQGVHAWYDDKAIEFAGDRAEVTLDAGHHDLTFRVDTAARQAKALMVEIEKTEGSHAEYVIVGGK
jgi:putative heme-binding domain-containing protein